MKTEEINKTIAGYMGEKISLDGAWVQKPFGRGYSLTPLYTESLDTCIPVVEKLSKATGYDILLKYVLSEKYWQAHPYGYETNESESPAFALATACAKAIKELK